MYREVGVLKIGDQDLPTFKSLKGTSQLENYHKHLKNFVPSDTCSGERLHQYHMEGTYRWNKFRENELLESPNLSKTLGLTKHYTLINSYSQKFFNKTLLPQRCLRKSTLRGIYGMEYLRENQKIRYQQGLQVFNSFKDPSCPEAPTPVLVKVTPAEGPFHLDENKGCADSSNSQSPTEPDNPPSPTEPDNPPSPTQPDDPPSPAEPDDRPSPTQPDDPVIVEIPRARGPVQLETSFETFGATLEKEEVNINCNAELFNLAKLLANLAIKDEVLELYEEKTIIRLFNKLEEQDKLVLFPRHYSSNTKEIKKYVKPSRSGVEGCEQMIRQKLSRKKTCIDPCLNSLSQCLIDRLHFLVLLEKNQPERIFKYYVNIQEKLIRSEYIKRNSDIVLVTQNLINIRKYLLKKSNKNVLYQASGQVRNLGGTPTTKVTPRTGKKNLLRKVGKLV